jgi:16S rRNA (cytidine1402-2'-O)-methyltransferase
LANSSGIGTLYVVATPIGNLDDMSARCIRVLKTVDLVAAEDTRRTGVLLKRIESSVKLQSFHAHSDENKANRIVDAMLDGQNVALVTDAGTPAVSDPGAGLVAHALAKGVSVIPIPGPSAATAALSVSGFSADRYTFMGFLARKGKARREQLRFIAESLLTVVLFESPIRLAPTLGDLASVLDASRRVLVAREITKLHEDYNVGTPTELEVYYRENPPKGEVTVVVEGRMERDDEIDPSMIEDRARELLAEGLTRKDVAARLVEELGVARNEVYRIVTNL